MCRQHLRDTLTAEVGALVHTDRFRTVADRCASSHPARPVVFEMPIPLPQLVQLAHELWLGRKRQREWEETAGQGRGQQPAACGAAEPSVETAPVDADEAAEMRLMRQELCGRGLTPRAPDVEHTFLRLLSSSARGARTLPATYGKDWGHSELDWLYTSNELDGRGHRQVSSRRPRVPGCRAANVEDALGRLSVILNASGSRNSSGYDTETTDDEAAWRAEMSREELLEAEMEERALQGQGLVADSQRRASPTPTPATIMKAGMCSEASPERWRKPFEGSPIPSVDTKSAKLSPILSPKRPKLCSSTVESVAGDLFDITRSPRRSYGRVSGQGQAGGVQG